MNNKKRKRLGPFAKRAGKFFGIIYITDWRSTLKNYYVLF